MGHAGSKSPLTGAVSRAPGIETASARALANGRHGGDRRWAPKVEAKSRWRRTLCIVGPRQGGWPLGWRGSRYNTAAAGPTSLRATCCAYT